MERYNPGEHHGIVLKRSVPLRSIQKPFNDPNDNFKIRCTTSCDDSMERTGPGEHHGVVLKMLVLFKDHRYIVAGFYYHI